MANRALVAQVRLNLPRSWLLATSLGGGLPPPGPLPAGTSGASGLSEGATAPRNPPTGTSGAPEAPVEGVREG
eukprot:15475672-Alexandrium_andersonii.AAC.1